MKDTCTEQTLARAMMADCLTARIAENVSAQQVDLNAWIFNRLAIAHGAKVLELCCGTGAQTKHLLARVGTTGQVVAVDKSRKALDALVSSVAPELEHRLQVVESSLDEIVGALAENGLGTAEFDLIFCAYGLYYSGNVRALLDTLERRLTANGRIVVVGPYGSNNQFLFEFLMARGVAISSYVMHTSRDFMWQEVIPWATTRGSAVRMEMLRNPVTWKSASSVLAYWENSTFFSEARRVDVEQGLEAHFATHGEFVNEKCIMLLEMSRRSLEANPSVA